MASGRWGPLVVMARRIGRHELIDRGAALTYYSVLSLVPGLLVLFSVIGLFGDQGTVDEVLNIFDDVGPLECRRERRGTARVADQQRHPVGHPPGRRPARGPVDRLRLHRLLLPGVGDDLGSRAPARVARVAPAGRAHGVVPAPARDRPDIIVLTGELASSVGDALGIEDGSSLYGFLKWPALLVVVTLLVALLYRTSPSRERSATHWRVLTPGARLRRGGLVVVSVGFEVYVNVFATYDDTYGALGTTIAGLVWLWLTNLTLLAGVELDAALEYRHEAMEGSSGMRRTKLGSRLTRVRPPQPAGLGIGGRADALVGWGSRPSFSGIPARPMSAGRRARRTR